MAVTSSSSVAESVAAFAASQRPPPRLLLLGSRPPSALFRSASRSIVHAAPVPALVVPRGCASSHTHQAPSHTHHHNHHHKSPEWVATQHLTGRLVCIAVDASSSGPALCAWAAATLLRSSDRVVVVHARPAPRAPAHAGEYDLELNDALGAVRCALRALETTGAAHAAKAGVEPLAGGGAGGGAGTWDGGTTRASAVSSFVLTPPVAKRGSGSSDNESDGSGHGGGGSGGGGKGGAAESIVNWADSSKPTMLVVGSSSRTKGSLLERWRLTSCNTATTLTNAPVHRLSAGSVSSLVLQRAKCPVLVVDPATLATFAKR